MRSVLSVKANWIKIELSGESQIIKFKKLIKYAPLFGRLAEQSRIVQMR